MADSLDEMIESGAMALGIPLKAEWKAEIKIQLQVSLRHGSLVAAFPLPDESEPAPVFKA